MTIRRNVTALPLRYEYGTGTEQGPKILKFPLFVLCILVQHEKVCGLTRSDETPVTILMSCWFLCVGWHQDRFHGFRYEAVVGEGCDLYTKVRRRCSVDGLYCFYVLGRVSTNGACNESNAHSAKHKRHTSHLFQDVHRP